MNAATRRESTQRFLNELKYFESVLQAAVKNKKGSLELIERVGWAIVSADSNMLLQGIFSVREAAPQFNFPGVNLAPAAVIQNLTVAEKAMMQVEDAADSKTEDPRDDFGLRSRVVVRRAWSTLALAHKRDLPVDLAAYYFQKHPYRDPWKGKVADFKRALWVCHFLSGQLQNRLKPSRPEWLRVRDAAAIIGEGIHPGSVSRAGTKGAIRTNGKRGRDRLLRRSDVMTYKAKRVTSAKQKDDREAVKWGRATVLS